MFWTPTAPDIGIDEYNSNFEFLISIAATITHYLSSIYCFLSFFTSISDKQIADIHGDATGVKRRIQSAPHRTAADGNQI